MIFLKSLNLLPSFPPPPCILLKFNPPGGPLRPAIPPAPPGAPGPPPIPDLDNPPGAEGMPNVPKFGLFPARRAAKLKGPLAGPGKLGPPPIPIPPGPAGAPGRPFAGEAVPLPLPLPPAFAPRAWERRRAPMDVALGLGPREGLDDALGAPWRDAASCAS